MRIDTATKERLRKELVALGFHRVGFTDSAVLQKDAAFLEKRGAGPFEPTDLPERTDPTLMLAGAKSVIAVGMSYHHRDPAKPTGVRGRLSKYCRGFDYHDLMLEKLELVAQGMQDEFGVESISFVDTGPPIEKAFAEKAGLGKRGKNTLLISPKFGSWLFLGVIVTQLEISPDAPATYSICGSCRLCIDACPTGCLTEWELDSKNCLGYLNQKYDDVPIEHREAMGDWLFGCDICQEVCPHNVKSQVGLMPEFAPLQEPGAFPDLRAMVHMTQGQFEDWFIPTAADWRGRDTIQRNALVALGNSQEEEAVDILLEAGCLEDSVLAEHARWAAKELSRRFPGREAELSAFREKIS